MRAIFLSSWLFFRIGSYDYSPPLLKHIANTLCESKHHVWHTLLPRTLEFPVYNTGFPQNCHDFFSVHSYICRKRNLNSATTAFSVLIPINLLIPPFIRSCNTLVRVTVIVLVWASGEAKAWVIDRCIVWASGKTIVWPTVRAEVWATGRATV